MVCIIKLICPQFRQSLTAHRVPRFSGLGNPKTQNISIVIGSVVIGSVVRTRSAQDFDASCGRRLEPSGIFRKTQPPARVCPSNGEAWDFASSCDPSRRRNRE
jgi:hypothetical protein